MIVIGFGILPFFVIWESKFAKFPVVPRRFLGNLSVMGASMIGFFDFVSRHVPSPLSCANIIRIGVVLPLQHVPLLLHHCGETLEPQERGLLFADSTSRPYRLWNLGRYSPPGDPPLQGIYTTNCSTLDCD